MQTESTLTEQFVRDSLYTNTGLSLPLLSILCAIYSILHFTNIPLRFWSMLTWLHHAISAYLTAAHSSCRSHFPTYPWGTLLHSDAVTGLSRIIRTRLSFFSLNCPGLMSQCTLQPQFSVLGTLR